MAYCAHCGNEIADTAVSCRNCGHPVKTVAASPVAWGAGSAAGTAPVEVGNYATFGERFAAALIDGILTVALLFLMVIPMSVIPFVGVILLPFPFAYQWLMISFNRGQTVGRMVMRIRVTAPDGQLIGPGRAAARVAMSWVSSTALYIGYLWYLWDPEKRTWHDIVADTRVYAVPK